MKLKIDRQGRVLIPRELRLRYGLGPGTELELSETAEGFTLRPVRSSPTMVNKDGIWVHQGVPSGKMDVAKIIRELRERF